MGRVGLRIRGSLGKQRSGYGPQIAFTLVYAELLLDFQVRETAHRLGSHRRLRRLLEEAPVALHRLIEALLDRHVLHVRAHLAQIGKRRLRVARGAADDESRGEQYRSGEAAHQRPSEPGWARAARS